MSEPNNFHYHIRWSGALPTDLEPFATVGEAESAARQMVRVGESYSIEKFDNDCIRCRQVFEDLLRKDAHR
jgi:hypothetical protein